jgi:hypothetical protein
MFRRSLDVRPTLNPTGDRHRSKVNMCNAFSEEGEREIKRFAKASVLVPKTGK